MISNRAPSVLQFNEYLFDLFAVIHTHNEAAGVDDYKF